MAVDRFAKALNKLDARRTVIEGLIVSDLERKLLAEAHGDPVATVDYWPHLEPVAEAVEGRCASPFSIALFE